jgi:Zn-finger nucleic acid-binding protein
MKCPVCNVALLMSEKKGIEVDYCPQCRGVWLDRGELDKIIERSDSVYDERYRKEHHEEFKDKHKHHEYEDKPYGHKKHKMKSFFEELFD